MDTSTRCGNLSSRAFAALAEFERDLIKERTEAGLTAARLGVQPGRPTVWRAESLRTARVLVESGEQDVATIAGVLGVSRASVCRGHAGVDRR